MTRRKQELCGYSFRDGDTPDRFGPMMQCTRKASCVISKGRWSYPFCVFHLREDREGYLRMGMKIKRLNP
jgi:hypothetical protein